MIQGKYFSFTSASVGEGIDLIEQAQNLIGIPDIVAKKLTLISSGSLAIDINNLGATSTLYMDTDLNYKLSLGDSDCLVTSLVFVQESASPVFLALVF
jgi:hypothetical protein